MTLNLLRLWGAFLKKFSSKECSLNDIRDYEEIKDVRLYEDLTLVNSANKNNSITIREEDLVTAEKEKVNSNIKHDSYVVTESNINDGLKRDYVHSKDSSPTKPTKESTSECDLVKLLSQLDIKPGIIKEITSAPKKSMCEYMKLFTPSPMSKEE